ncbi:MAG: hypothetical protein Q9195_002002 [Heterodermia aff. obscurata]
MTSLASPLVQLDGTVYINNEPDVVDITRVHPGQTFVGILPGHKRPAFVRKRRKSGSCFTDLFRPKRTHSSEYFYHSYTGSNPPHYLSRSPSPPHIKIVTDNPFIVTSGASTLPSSEYLRYVPGPARLTKHTCGSCGKFRSNNYCKSHPLAEGEEPKPSLCRKCVHNKTSSGESDRSYEKYVKEQKRRRRRQIREADDESYERYRKAQKRRRASSMSDSYERYRETRSYQRRRRTHTESRDESSYSSNEGPKMRPRRAIYVESSDSRRRARSSSADESIVSVSFKRAAPRSLRNRSRSQSSAEEVRIVRSILRESPRPRARSSPYRHRYRSESRSEGSVRFELPPREREPRKYRVLDYDGESGPHKRVARNSLQSRSYSTESVRDRTRGSERTATLEETGDRFLGHAISFGARREKDYQSRSPLERREQASPSYSRRIATPDNVRYLERARESDLDDLTFMTGSRGRSLSSERRLLERQESPQRKRHRRSRSVGRAGKEYSEAHDESQNDSLKRPRVTRTSTSSLNVERLNSRMSDPVPPLEVELHSVWATARTIVVLLGSRPAEHPPMNRPPVVIQIAFPADTVIGSLLEDRPLDDLFTNGPPPALLSTVPAGIDNVLQREICLQAKTVAGTLEAE